MAFAKLKRDVGARLRRCVDHGLPEWVTRHAEERIACATFHRDSSQAADMPSEAKRQSFDKAVKVLSEVNDLLHAFERHVRFALPEV
ncbi:hypothetical protein [Comamonas koreensis]|uniref:Uncharacterized protein n=1 Tax=Comamonas koreensis TaxID=160825 RepID=A0AAW4Y1R6_9BURK|nr:hypothetical protein [Comamonas koreensis]MCD2167238.1 hypothetical protein [Comamonas koreensis]